MATHRDVAAAWAGQTKPKLVAGHLKFRGRWLYSYGMPIGYLLVSGGVTYALVSDMQYSSSTSRCQGIAADEAAKAGLEVKRLPYASPERLWDSIAVIDRRILEERDAITRARAPTDLREARIAWLVALNQWILSLKGDPEPNRKENTHAHAA